jgi:hypothetical protein
LKKNAGMAPGVLAWLVDQFPTAPLPEMLLPLTVGELEAYRAELAERLRRVAVG